MQSDSTIHEHEHQHIGWDRHVTHSHEHAADVAHDDWPFSRVVVAYNSQSGRDELWRLSNKGDYTFNGVSGTPDPGMPRGTFQSTGGPLYAFGHMYHWAAGPNVYD